MVSISRPASVSISAKRFSRSMRFERRPPVAIKVRRLSINSANPIVPAAYSLRELLTSCSAAGTIRWRYKTDCRSAFRRMFRFATKLGRTITSDLLEHASVDLAIASASLIAPRIAGNLVGSITIAPIVCEMVPVTLAEGIISGKYASLANSRASFRPSTCRRKSGQFWILVYRHAMSCASLAAMGRGDGRLGGILQRRPRVAGQHSVELSPHRLRCSASMLANSFSHLRFDLSLSASPVMDLLLARGWTQIHSRALAEPGFADRSNFLLASAKSKYMERTFRWRSNLTARNFSPLAWPRPALRVRQSAL